MKIRMPAAATARPVDRARRDPRRSGMPVPVVPPKSDVAMLTTSLVVGTGHSAGTAPVRGTGGPPEL